MKLEQYITDLCAKLRGGEEVKLEAMVDMPFRHLMASLLTNHLTGPATVVVEGLLREILRLQNVCDDLDGQRAYFRDTLKELEAMNASKLIEATPVKAKPKPKAKLTLKPAINSVTKDTAKLKRTIQPAPKKGNIEQEKLDAAMHGLRKRRAEKKAAQKAGKE